MKGGKGRGRRPQRDEGHKVNDRIRAVEVRVISDDGTMLGTMGIRDALRTAEDKGLDLIEVAPNAKPPTCKIMDYGRWKYENKKKASESRKKQTIVSVKEVQMRPRTEDHDLETKLKHATKFLLSGDKVKVNLRFSGREMAHQELGYELLVRVTKMLDNISNVEALPKKEGRQLFTIVAPDAKKIKAYKELKKRESKMDAAEAAVDGVEETPEGVVTTPLEEAVVTTAPPETVAPEEAPETTTEA